MKQIVYITVDIIQKVENNQENRESFTPLIISLLKCSLSMGGVGWILGFTIRDLSCPQIMKEIVRTKYLN